MRSVPFAIRGPLVGRANRQTDRRTNAQTDGRAGGRAAGACLACWRCCQSCEQAAEECSQQFGRPASHGRPREAVASGFGDGGTGGEDDADGMLVKAMHYADSGVGDESGEDGGEGSVVFRISTS